MSIKGRITLNKLKDWVNSEFIKFGITEYVCTEVKRTYLMGREYENGAAFLWVCVDKVGEDKRHPCFPCFYSIKTLQEHINSGKYRIILGEQHRQSLRTGGLSALEIELQKI